MRAGSEPESHVIGQWRSAGPALAEVRRRELRSLSEGEALSAAQALLELLPWVPLREQGSGLVEQQRLFSRRHV